MTTSVLDTVTPVRAARDSPATRILDGRYRLLSLLGAGSMGTVWLAHDELLARDVALKEIPRGPSHDCSAAVREACAAARVNHTGTVTVYDVLSDDERNTDWIVMEALSGPTLADAAASASGLGHGETRRILVRLLAALDAIHDAGLVHRDIKPANIQMCPDGRVVITDFGLASPPCVVGDARSAWVAGSIPYLAPEILSEGSYSAASDFYALGATLRSVVRNSQPGHRRGHQDAVDRLLPVMPTPAGATALLLTGLLDPNPVTRFDAECARRHP